MLADRVSQVEPLSQEEQRRILDQLQTALGSADPEEQQGGREILDRFSKRADLFADVDRRLGQLLALKDTPSAPGPISRPDTSELGAGGGGIFISYRRGNENFVAGRLYDNLRARFDPNTVFMDVDSIDLGLDFTKVIDQKLSQCSVALVIIGRDWTSVAGTDGRRRLENPSDFVRIEVEKALARDDIRVIPIYVDGASPPDESALPGPLAALARRNGINISHGNFGSDFGRLVKILERVTYAEPGAPPASGPQPVAVPPPFPNVEPADTAGAGRARRSRTRWLIAGSAGLAVMVAIVIAVVLITRPGPPSHSSLGSILLSDEQINAIMGASDMKTVEDGNSLKAGMVEVSPQDCMGVLYPGVDQTYQGSGVEDVTWKVLEKPGGLQRAGDGNHDFVDQTVAAFPHNTDRALAFVRRSANQWKACTGQTVTATYIDGKKYTWTVGDLTGLVSTITQSYTQEGGGYACQRLLSSVSNTVVDIKACGDHIPNEASRKIAASVAQAPAF